MSELEGNNGSTEKENRGNPLPSSIASFSSVFQNLEFVSMMSKAFLPTIVDGARNSLSSPTNSESHGSSQAKRFTGLSYGSTKGNSILCPIRPLCCRLVNMWHLI